MADKDKGSQKIKTCKCGYGTNLPVTHCANCGKKLRKSGCARLAIGCGVALVVGLICLVGLVVSVLTGVLPEDFSLWLFGGGIIW